MLKAPRHTINGNHDADTMTDDTYARFIIAQQLIEDRRFDEARMILRTIDDIPEAQDWAARLEQGESIDVDEMDRVTDLHFPPPPPVPERPTISIRRLAFSAVMVLALMAPLLQMLTFSAGPVYPSRNAAERGEARLRVQYLCRSLVDQALADGSLDSEFGSCMDWSLNLPSDSMQAVVRCHLQAGPRDTEFRECVIDQQLFPDDIVTFGQNI